MKSLEELKALQKALIEEDNKKGFRIMVGMATCGIAAGAREVMQALLEAKETLGLSDVEIIQTGCSGVCRLEPMFDVFDPQGDRTTYVDMTPEKAVEVLERHVLSGEIIKPYTIVAYD